jgi:glycerophosphoryl diester phosphodiesterase
VLVSSFNLADVDRVRSLDPSIPTALLAAFGPDADVAGRFVDRARRRGHGAVHPHHGAVTAHLVDLAHAGGLEVNTWTVDDPDRIRALAALGVDGIVTNVPDIALAALAAPEGRAPPPADGARRDGRRRALRAHEAQAAGSWRRTRSSTVPRKSPSTW